MSEDETRPEQVEPAARKTPENRRAFLRTAAWGGGIAGIGGLAGYAAHRFAKRQGGRASREAALGEEFKYDVSRFQKSDPSLLRYEEAERWPVAEAAGEPRNIAAGPAGGICVAGDGGIQKIDPEGGAGWVKQLRSAVYAVAMRPSGEILTGHRGEISVLDGGGAVRDVWSDFPEGFLPTGMDVWGGEVFVADAGNRVVLRIDGSGRTMGVIGQRDPGRNVRGFVVPSPYFTVRMAPDGLLRVTNPGAHRIEAFTVDGDFELAWGKASFAVEGFCGCCNPVSFDIFADGSFVTCEKGLPRVKLYDSHGEFTGLVAGPEAFPDYVKAANAGTPDSRGTGIYAAVDPTGDVVVLDPMGRNVRLMKRKETADA